MQKKAIIILFFILSAAILSSCKGIRITDCLERLEGIDSVTVDLDPFTEIDLYDKLEIYLIDDSIYKLKIIANKNMIENIEYSVNNSSLTVKDRSICNFSRSYDLIKEVYIHAPNIEKLFIHGPINLYSSDTLFYNEFLIRTYSKVSNIDIKVDCNHFFLEQWNATGNYSVKGETVFYSILNHGNSYIYSKDLKSDYVTVNHKSSGDVYISSEKTINAYIYDIGNIYYTGNPEKITVSEKTSTGEIIKIDE